MTFTHDATSDHQLTLSDGRILGYSEFGDPAGYPVVNNHGGLVCRLDVEPAAVAARELGVRIISPDRPGVASSDPSPGRDTIDWADDVGELLAVLGVAEFAVMGWSMGGQYALALPARFGERVTATAVIAGCPPLTDPDTFAELNSMDRHLTDLSAKHPAAARATFATMARLEGMFPERMAKVSTRGAAVADQKATLANADLLAHMMQAAMEDRQGMVEEYLAWVRPWRFSLADLQGPVAVWQGTEDDLVPAQWGNQLAESIPGGVLHPLPDQGHLIGLTHRREVMADLLATAH